MRNTNQETFWDQQVLAYDPFGGDKDDGGFKQLSDKVVVARKKRKCCECGQNIIPKTKIRVMTAVGDGKVSSISFCHACCGAMVEWENGNWEPLESRLALRR